MRLGILATLCVFMLASGVSFAVESYNSSLDTSDVTAQAARLLKKKHCIDCDQRKPNPLETIRIHTGNAKCEKGGDCEANHLPSDVTPVLPTPTPAKPVENVKDVQNTAKDRPQNTEVEAPKKYIPCKPGGTADSSGMKDIEAGRLVYALIQHDTQNKWSLAREGDGRGAGQLCSYIYIGADGKPESQIVPSVDVGKEQYNSRVFGKTLGLTGSNADTQFELYPNGLMMPLPCPARNSEVWAWGFNAEGKDVQLVFKYDDGKVTQTVRQIKD